MRLLNANTKKLEPFHNHELPRYAIVSHRWGPESEEVLFADVDNVPRAKRKGKGYAKVLAACQQATRDGLSYVWLDTCCIDKSNQVELTEAINSMHRWYHTSAVCYAYLHDADDISMLCTSEWFRRGWTLQELIAPRTLKFFDKHWTLLGYRDAQPILDLVTKCTNIDVGVLGSERAPRDVSIAQRMRWAAGRITTKEEDKAYSLLGLFGVHMSATYGIGHKAFEKLQHKIMKVSPDHSLFAWSPAVDHQNAPPHRVTGFLAGPTLQYLNVYEIPAADFYRNLGFPRMTWESCSFKSGAVCTRLPIRRTVNSPSVYEVLLRCSIDPPQHPTQRQRPLVVYLTDAGRFGRYVRIHDPVSWSSCEDDVGGNFVLERIHVDENVLGDPSPQRRSPILLPLNEGPDAVPSTSPVGEPTTENAAENPEDIIHKDQSTQGPLPIRHPQGIKTTNIIVCGEPGAGAAGVVNLIFGRNVVVQQEEFKRSAMSFTTYDITTTTPPRNLRIFYVVGPQEYRLDESGCDSALENATKLAQRLCDEGGVHLLVCCMLKTKIDRKTHSLFYQALCGMQVPAIVLVTGCGPGAKSAQVDLTGIGCKEHALISVTEPPDASSHRKKVQSLLSIGLQEPFHPQDGPRMRTELQTILREFLTEPSQEIVKSPVPAKDAGAIATDGAGTITMNGAGAIATDGVSVILIIIVIIYFYFF